MRLIKFCSAFLAIVLICSSFGVVSFAEDNYSEKIGKNLSEKFSTIGSDETVPVYVWYNDIDYTVVENSVLSETGLRKSDLNTDLEMPNESVLSAIGSMSEQNYSEYTDYNEENIKLDMSLYFAKTSNQRKIERKITDEYVSTERKLAKEMYADLNSKIMEELSVDNNNIIYQSKYAPVSILLLTKPQIESIIKKTIVTYVDLYVEENIECTYETAKSASRIDRVVEEVGLTGKDVKVGVIDSGYPDQNSQKNYTLIDIDDNYPVGESSHASNTVNILAGDNGVAPNSIIYSTNASYNNIEAMIDQGVNIINISLGMAKDNYYNSVDKWFDHLASHHSVTFVCSAGNDFNQYVHSPAKAYNSIAVGSFNDDGSVFYEKLSSYDSGNSCEKPDLVASSNLGGGGTSSSAPIVTGIIALITELKPSLLGSPETIKAILMASCHQKAKTNDNEKMSDGITNKQGVGIVDAYNAICIVGRQQYFSVNFSNSFERYLEIGKYGATNINISLAWIRDNSVQNNCSKADNISEGINNNLSLKVYDANTDILRKTSDLSNSSTEMVYVPFEKSLEKLRLSVYNSTSSTELVDFSMAWSTNNSQYRTTGENEGLYYIRNKVANKYLNINSGSAIINQFNTEDTQKWFIKKIDDNCYKLYDNSSSNQGYLTSGSSLGSKGAISAVVDTSGNGDINLIKNDDGTFRILQKNPAGDETIGLELFDGMTKDGSLVSWYNYYGWNNQKWYLEKAYYAFGDCNMDGEINTKDVLALRKHIAGSEQLSNYSKYLADVNQDGSINMKDVLYIQKVIVGQDGYLI